MTRKKTKPITPVKARHRTDEAERKLLAARDGDTAKKREKSYRKAWRVSDRLR